MNNFIMLKNDKGHTEYNYDDLIKTWKLKTRIPPFIIKSSLII
jgi:hypothetical protein